jgi:hypothetical protein
MYSKHGLEIVNILDLALCLNALEIGKKVYFIVEMPSGTGKLSVFFPWTN